MIGLFNSLFYRPLFNLLVLIYNLIPGHDIGLTIIVLTLLIKTVLYPLSLKSVKSQKAMQELQPKIDALKKQYKNDKEGLARATMEFYKQEKVSPFSSCLPLLIQLPFLIAVYWVFRNGLTKGSLDILYPFVQNPGLLNPTAFGFIDLSKVNFVMALLAGGAQFFQVKMLSSKKPPIKTPGAKDENMMAVMNKQMTFFMPVMTVIIGMSLPSGLMLYWLVNSAFTIVQQFFAFGKKDKKVEVIDRPESKDIETK